MCSNADRRGKASSYFLGMTWSGKDRHICLRYLFFNLLRQSHQRIFFYSFCYIH